MTSSSSKLLLPVALGVSLLTVTAFVVYYVFKKDEENEQSNKKRIRTTRINTIEVQVPKSIVPALIGRGGSHIKEVEKKSGALTQFKKNTDKDYDVCIIRGRTEATQLAETLIHEFMKNQPIIEEDSMNIPNWACGRIIGSGGENINEMSHRSGAKIKLEGSQVGDNNILRRVTLRGTKQQIITAKELIEKCVAEVKCRREIEQSKRTPRHIQQSTEATNGSSESGGAAIEVFVSAVSSPSRFWVQFVGPQVSQLDELVEQMTEYYNNKDNREAHALSEVSVGQVVAAVFRHDGRWYRARVADIRPNEFDASKQVADVFYLDYGDSEYVGTHELCELRADLLRLRFQAMECFLAGVHPAGDEEDVIGMTASGQRWDKWNPTAIERFEELTQVARWKPLVSKTCTYKKTVNLNSGEGDKEKEIPGIKLYNMTDDGEVDVGDVLVAEGWAAVIPPASSPRASPARTAPSAPPTAFGDLGASRVLGMVSETGERAKSPSKERDRSICTPEPSGADDNSKIPSNTSESDMNINIQGNVPKPSDMSYPTEIPPKLHINGSHDFINTERQNAHEEVLNESPNLERKTRDETKANMNRIDSHHGNLEALGRMHHETH